MIELTYFSDEVGTWNTVEQLRLGREAGATGIEARSKLLGHDINDLTDEAAGVLKKYLEDKDMRLAIVGSGVGKCNLDDPDEVALNHTRFARMCELAHFFDTKVIRVFAGWNRLFRDEKKEIWDTDAELPRIKAFFEPILDLAAKENVVLGLEPEYDTNAATCEHMSRVFEALGNPQEFGVAWDVVNSTRKTGELPLPNGYDKIRGRVVHMHVKPDSKGTIETVADLSLIHI